MMRVIPSWVVFWIVIVSGAVAVFANAWYPTLKEREQNLKLSKNAMDILRPEIKQNREIAARMKSLFESNKESFETLNVSAWETVSRGGLLVGLEPDKVTKLLRAYSLSYKANELHDRYVDATVGIVAALGFATKLPGVIKAALEDILGQLDSALSDVDE
jgi:hypothetical protein